MNVLLRSSPLALLLMATPLMGQSLISRQRALLPGQWQAQTLFGPDTVLVTLVFRPDGTGSIRYAQKPALPFAYSIAAPNRLQLTRNKRRSVHFIYELTRQELRLGPPPARDKMPEVFETLAYQRR